MKRSEQDIRFQWDLTKIYPDTAAWETAMQEAEAALAPLAAIPGTLGTSKEAFKHGLDTVYASMLKVELPYIYAFLKKTEDGSVAKNQEMAAYLKALEPEGWHNEQEKVRQLMPYKLPAKLVEYLKTGPLRLEFPERELVKWAELYPYMDVQEMTWKRKKLLSLMAKMDNYSDYLLLWSPRDKKLWYLDIEHEEFHPLARWEEFIADPGKYLNGMIEGEFEE